MTYAAARDEEPRDGPLRNSLGNIVKDGKPKGAWEDKRGGGGKKSDWVEKRVWTREEIDAQDSDFGYEKFVDGEPKEGWLITFSPTTVTHSETNKEIAAVECYLTMQVQRPLLQSRSRFSFMSRMAQSSSASFFIIPTSTCLSSKSTALKCVRLTTSFGKSTAIT